MVLMGAGGDNGCPFFQVSHAESSQSSPTWVTPESEDGRQGKVPVQIWQARALEDILSQAHGP